MFKEIVGKMNRKIKTIVAILAVFLLAILIQRQCACGLDYQNCYWQKWTGFGKFTAPSGVEISRTLWDWLSLFIVPSLLAYGVWRLNKSQEQNKQDIESTRQRQTALENYYDKMSELMLEENLRGVKIDPSQKNDLPTKNNSDEARRIARTRTLGLMQVLDSNRKAQALQFLYESDLIVKNNPIIDLLGIDLTEANLEKASLPFVRIAGADFTNANLEGVNLKEAFLVGSEFKNTSFKNANLSEVDFEQAVFNKIDFSNADFAKTNVRAATFNGVNLKNANNFTQEMLDTVGNIKETILPAGLEWKN